VGEAVHRRDLLGADGATARRHHHQLVPLERESDLLQVVDLGQPSPEFSERGVQGVSSSSEADESVLVRPPGGAG
jgi:hypothetical protein